MKIGVHDAERDHMPRKTFPNLALMKLSAWHKAQGRAVEWWEPGKAYDRVYSSKVFDFTPENPALPSDAIKGGTGYGLYANLPEEVEAAFPDYGLYPNCDYALGFLTRGCPNNCPWCVVPKKEGAIHPAARFWDIVRADTDKLVLLDNNILACSHGVAQLEELGGTRFRVDVNQGMDARLITPEIAKILSRVKWIKSLRFACDSKAQIEPVERAARLLGEHGIKPWRLFVYVLVRKDVEDAAYRVERLKQLWGISLYAQAERNPALGIMPDAAQKEFANRYVYSGKFRAQTWGEYCRDRGARA